MPKYKLNYIHIDTKNVKTFGILHLAESEAKDIETVKNKVAKGDRSAILFSVESENFLSTCN